MTSPGDNKLLSPAKQALLKKWAREGLPSAFAPELVPIEAATAGLSFVQERQLFLELLDPGTAVNNLAVAIALDGRLDVDLLERSANSVIARHDILRTSFEWDGSTPIVRVADKISMPLRPVEPVASMEEALRAAEAFARRPFAIDQGPLLRTSLVQTGSQAHLLTIVAHHTIADGWSLGLLLDELFAGYRTLAQGRSSQPLRHAIPYSEHAARQRQQDYSKQLDFWLEQLQGPLPVLDLPNDFPRANRQTFAGALHRRCLPADLSLKASELGRQCGATQFMVLLAGFMALLNRYCREDDMLVGTPVGGRNRAAAQSVIGPCLNTLALRTSLAGNPSFSDLVGRVRDTMLPALANAELPFEKLVAALRPQRDLSRTPIFQVLFNLHNAPASDFDLPGLEAQLFDIDNGAAQFDLALNLRASADGLAAQFTYNSDLFEEATIARLGQSYAMLLEGGIAEPDRPLSSIALLTAAERESVVARSRGVEAAIPLLRLYELVVAQAEQCLDQLALVAEDRELTYRELLVRAKTVSDELQALGIDGDCVVGLRLDRTSQLPITLLGILMAGAAFLPLDPAWPEARAKLVLDDAEARFLIDEDGVQKLDWPDKATGRIAAQDMAYVIYTSGSTGRPKGVQVGHPAVVNLLCAMRERIGIKQADRFMAVSPIAFDISILELLLPLVSGGTLVLASCATVRDPQKLAIALKNDINFLQATPATWRMLLDSGWEGTPGLTALCGGEALPPDLAMRLRSSTGRLWNVYGPTETTIWSAAREITGPDSSVRIGNPLANTQMFVLDPHLELLPPGAIGELFIGGAGLASQYVGLQDLTAERFVVAPEHLGLPTQGRLFRTGDCARLHADGSIELLGRFDDQIKLNGFRIEPGEVELALRSHPAIQDAVVVARAATSGAKQLVAYIVTDEFGPADAELRELLRQQLPVYAVPARFVRMLALPLNSSGKVARSELPDPPAPQRIESRLPQSALEAKLVSVYAEILGLDWVRVEDNFFDLGGGSLQLLEIIARLRESGLDPSPELFFEHQTAAELAAALDKGVS